MMKSIPTTPTTPTKVKKTTRSSDRNPSRLQKHENECHCAKVSSKNVTFSPTTVVDDDELALRRQQLELSLSNNELEELHSTDAHKNLQERYDRVESTLEAFTYYMDSVNLEMKACFRLCQQLNGLIDTEKALAMDEDLLDLTKKICEDTDREFVVKLKQKFYSLLDDKNDLDRCAKEYDNRKQDFKVASQNFRILLNATNLQMRQMDKLQSQYDKILANYQHSRCMLDRKIPNVIAQQISVLLTCFCEFSEELEKLATERNDMSQLFQHLETSLKVSGGLTLKRKTDDGDNSNDVMKLSNCNICYSTGL